MKDRILSTELTPAQLGLFFLGQEGFIFKFRDRYVLMDGYLTGPLKAPGIVWGRNFEAPIKPEELDFVDLVLCSHDHMDHTDPHTLKKLAEVNTKAKFIIPAFFKENVVRYGVAEERIIAAKDGEAISLPELDLTVLPVASAHEELRQNENGDYEAMGYRFDFDGITVYHCGDSLVYEGQAEKVGHVDICMLPVNGRSYYKLKANCIGNMTLEEAVLFAKGTAPELFVPMHIDMFDVNTIPAGYIPAAIEQYAPGLFYHIFTHGERYIFMK